MISYWAKVDRGATIVSSCIASGNIDSIYSELDKNNTYIGPNENRDPSNFKHYKVIDDFGYAEVSGLEDYVKRQGYDIDFGLEG